MRSRCSSIASDAGSRADCDANARTPNTAADMGVDATKCVQNGKLRIQLGGFPYGTQFVDAMQDMAFVNEKAHHTVKGDNCPCGLHKRSASEPWTLENEK